MPGLVTVRYAAADVQFGCRACGKTEDATKLTPKAWAAAFAEFLEQHRHT